jgi:hypothetical protein
MQALELGIPTQQTQLDLPVADDVKITWSGARCLLLRSSEIRASEYKILKRAATICLREMLADLLGCPFPGAL